MVAEKWIIVIQFPLVYLWAEKIIYALVDMTRIVILQRRDIQKNTQLELQNSRMLVFSSKKCMHTQA